MKKVVNIVKNIISPEYVIGTIIKCWINTCGIVLIYNFFYYEEIEHSRNFIQQELGIVFPFIMSFILTYRILPKLLFDKENSEISNGEQVISNAAIARESKQGSIVHEAGHAVMVYLLGYKSFSVEVTYIHPRVVSLLAVENENDIKNLIQIYYAGAAAEEIITGSYTYGCMSGPDSDFIKATELIKRYVVMTSPDVSKTLLDQELTEKVISVSKEMYIQTKDILLKNRDKIEKLIAELERKPSLSDQEVKRYLDAKRYQQHIAQMRISDFI